MLVELLTYDHGSFEIGSVQWHEDVDWFEVTNFAKDCFELSLKELRFQTLLCQQHFTRASLFHRLRTVIQQSLIGVVLTALGWWRRQPMMQIPLPPSTQSMMRFQLLNASNDRLCFRLRDYCRLSRT